MENTRITYGKEFRLSHRLEVVRCDKYTLIYLPQEKVWRKQDADDQRKFLMDEQEKQEFLDIAKEPGVKVYYLPGKTVTEEEFFGENGDNGKEKKKMFPRFFIGLDGFVNCSTHFQPHDGKKGPRANFNHHHGIRESTKSTCKQVHAALVPGGPIDKHFRTNDDQFIVKLALNHLDEDGEASIWEFVYREKIHELDVSGERRAYRSRVIQLLLDDIGDIDEEGGVSPLPLIETEEIKALFCHVQEVKSTSIACTYTERLNNIFYNINRAIEKTLRGEERDRENVEESFRFLGRGKGFTVVTDTQKEARNALRDMGVEAAVLHKGQLENGSHVFTIQRFDMGSPFPLEKIIDMLNRMERVPKHMRHKPPQELITYIQKPDAVLVPEKEEDQWGGDNKVSGSPRENGTWMDPNAIRESITCYLAQLESEQKKEEISNQNTVEDVESGKALLDDDTGDE